MKIREVLLKNISLLKLKYLQFESRGGFILKHLRYEEINDGAMRLLTEEYQRYLPIFQRLGLRPRRYFYDRDAAYVGTIEGWFRLGFKKYSKQELKWLRRILEYLHERSFHNWAVPWQKTIIWEEHSFCYLIQPWLLAKDHFQPGDPASLSRIAEITTELYNSGKDYFENRGIEIIRDRWQSIDFEWENTLHKLDQFKNDFEHDKTRKEFDELRKNAITVLNDCLESWKKSGLSTLLEHHQHSGVLGHGNLSTKNIVWLSNDYYLLNWEGLAFQPRIVDVASLINDVAWWEPDWILFLLNEYAKIQPFWPEEHAGLFALLRYPKKVIDILNVGGNEDFLNPKDLKGEIKELARKERCLTKAWKELGTQKRWAWGRQSGMPSVDPGKISMVLSPVESWGDFAGQADSLIQIQHDQKLPTDVMERLNYNEPDQVMAGRDGNVLESAAKESPAYNENNFIEIVEPQPKIPNENQSYIAEEEKTGKTEIRSESLPDLKAEGNETAVQAEAELPHAEPKVEIKNEERKELNSEIRDNLKIGVNRQEKIEPKKNSPAKPGIVSWGKFPKPIGADKKLGNR